MTDDEAKRKAAQVRGLLAELASDPAHNLHAACDGSASGHVALELRLARGTRPLVSFSVVMPPEKALNLGNAVVYQALSANSPSLPIWSAADAKRTIGNVRRR